MAARAPRPGAAEADEAAAAARQLIRIVVHSHECGPVLFAPGHVSIKEKMLVRKATGLSFESFLVDIESGTATMGSDTIALWWWLARRRAGELGLTFDRACTDWDEHVDTDADFDMFEVDPDEVPNHPEA